MPKTETVIRVFVASPSDVSEERAYLEEIVGELNLTLSRSLGVRLELVKWETHVNPGIGLDAQDVVNQQIQDDYDIFIGILWKRFGTPTGRAASGTAEEFDRAYARFEKDSSSVRIMIYFKDAPVSPSEMDVEQLSRIKSFQGQLKEKGALYWSYKDRDEFGKFLRLHLTREVQDLVKRLNLPQPLSKPQSGSPNSSSGGAQAETASQQDHEDEGLLDLLEASEEGFGRGSEAAARMVEAIEDLGKKMQQRAADVQGITQTGRPLDIKEAKRHTNRAAEDIQDFVTRMNTEMPIMSEGISKGLDAMVRIAQVSVDFNRDKDAINTASNQINAFATTLSGTRKNMADFRQIIDKLPRTTSNLNRAKRNAVEVLNAFDAHMDRFIKLSEEVQKSLNILLKSG